MFCGRAVKVLVKDLTHPIQDLQFYAEFHPEADVPELLREKSISLAKAKSLERFLKRLKNPYYVGQVVHTKDVGSFEVLFNTQSEGWHYGKVSSKHTSHVKHVLRIYVLKKDNETMQLIHSLSSPPFTMFCRRRNRKSTPTIREKKVIKRKKTIPNVEIMVWKVAEAVLKHQKSEESVDNSTPTLTDLIDEVLPEFSELENEQNVCNFSFIEKENEQLMKKLDEKVDKNSSSLAFLPCTSVENIIENVGCFLVTNEDIKKDLNFIQNNKIDFNKRKKILIEVLALKISEKLNQYNLTLESLDLLLQEQNISTKRIKVKHE